ncbi:ATPase, AAA family domain containing protein [Babesia caballi]|uniref:ATPase, AAA family domain containing protein n=1 Tax=Babesia caballi TaxID=5871 RepID=A0AAV4LTW5_BABCB|nr:ATPase, AAA family domain containing protein [Babesia caballi]
MATFNVSLTFLARKAQFSAEGCGQNVVVMPAQLFKKYRIEHGSTMLAEAVNGDGRVCVKLHNAVEYGLEYSFLKPPKVVASEELIRSLGAEVNAPIALKLSPCGQLPPATKVTLTYVEHFDHKEGSWRVTGASDEDKSGRNDGHTDAYRNYMDWSAASTGEDGAYPTSRWWYMLLKGDMSQHAVMSLSGAALAPGNVVALNLKGVLARFKVADAAANVKGAAGGGVSRVTESTQVVIKLPKNEHVPQPIRKKAECNKLAGLKVPIDTLKHHVVYPLVYGEKYAKLGIHPPMGVILHGPPGCGKTMIAKAMREGFNELFGIKEEVTVQVKLVQSSDLISSLVGRTEENIAGLFKECAEVAKRRPCICFIDEIDVLCRKRDGSTEFNTRNVTAFLNNMDGVGSQTNTQTRNRGYVIIGATNDVDAMDAALRRPGRFDLEVEVGVPTSAERLEILRSMLNELHHNLGEREILHVNDYCQAFVGADLKQLVANASWARLSKIQSQGGDSSLEETVDGATKPEGGDETSQLVTFDDFKMALNVTRPSALRELYVHVTNVRWEDIGGYEDVKTVLKECVEYPRTYSAAYEKMHVQTPRGVLLYGPPGCSKTLMAKAVATESHMNFISVKGPELFSKWVGESERAIRQLFRRARTNAPCVIFFDEMDSISVSRELSDSGGVGSRVLSQLLNEMDGINALKQVLVIGATNRPDLMDAALLRPGRLDRLVYIPLPDVRARKSIFSIYLKRLPTDGFDVEAASAEFATSTEGCSGAEIAMICRESAMSALRELIERDAEAKKRAVEPTDGGSQEVQELEHAMGELKLTKIVPVSIKHVAEAIARVKPRTKRETIRFYEEYKAKHPF